MIQGSSKVFVKMGRDKVSLLPVIVLWKDYKKCRHLILLFPILFFSNISVQVNIFKVI